ncbi:MAG: hypothetical protein GY778_23220, partial [bacterium]|nr:hypothetical protein [bacterium]
MASASAFVDVVALATCFTDLTATGTGDATICFTGGDPASCGFTQVGYIPLEGNPLSPPPGSAPAGLIFPHGLVTFTIGESCTIGFTAQFTWTLPSALPPGTQYWKYGPTPADPAPHWYVLPATIAGNVISYSITDGELGDHDLTADGVIVDPSGPGALSPVPLFSKLFAPSPISLNGISTLTLTI